ncbi:MAG: hypothetical protein PVH62_07445 [Anaerolineae bacterium]
MSRRGIVLLLVIVMACVTSGQAGPSLASPSPHLGYGMMLAWPGHLDQMTAAEFDWYKHFLRWSDVEPAEGGGYQWDTVDWRLQEAASHDVHLILRVEQAPDWARAWQHEWAPVDQSKMADWQAFFQATAAHIRDWQESHGTSFRVALEVWNEPNLDFQWGGEPVDPDWYTEMVRSAYQGAKAGDSHVIVVAGGLAPTGGTGDGRAMNDVEYLEAMYGAGLAGHFDAIGTHNYGFGGPPENKSWGSGILNFRRAEDIHAVMVAHGDGDKPVWATEFGWLLDASYEGHAECVDYWEDIGFAWQRVSPEQQADYLVDAFQYADANWPWMGVMVVSNLDFSTPPWYATCDPLRWFSILRSDASPRPAYTALQGMSKRPRSWPVWGMTVQPSSLTLLADVDEPGVQTRQVTVQNSGMELWETWSAVTATWGLSFAVTPTSGVPGEAFTVEMGVPGTLGVYTGVITVTASQPEVPESPFVVPLTLRVVPEVRYVHLPVVMRR